LCSSASDFITLTSEHGLSLSISIRCLLSDQLVLRFRFLSVRVSAITDSFGNQAGQVPIHPKQDSLTLLLCPVNDVTVLKTILENSLCNLHIQKTVFGEFLHLPRFEPLEGLKAVSGFAPMEGLNREVIQTQSIAETLMDVL